MKVLQSFDFNFGVDWSEVFIARKEGYSTSVTDYHEHEFFEINLILSGDVKILMKNQFAEGTQNRVVLTPPKAPHYVACKPTTVYKRLYLLFTPAFIAHYFPAQDLLFNAFGEHGKVLALNEEQTQYFKIRIEEIEQEQDLFCKQMLIYRLLFKFANLLGTNEQAPSSAHYLMESISYIETHYADKITAELLAKKCFVGRTKLMSEFKKHVGTTLGEYLTTCRLKNALRLLKENQTIEYTAEQCGFSDSSGFIRAFKKHFHTTPHRYIKEN